MEATSIPTQRYDDAAAERDHELRASLFGIEAAANAWNEHRPDDPRGAAELAAAIASEARRLRALLQHEPKQLIEFDLIDAVRPVITVARSLGLVVNDSLPSDAWVHGCPDDTAQATLSLFHNAHVHAGASPVDVHISRCRGTTTLHIDDRGPGIRDQLGQPLFARGHRGPKSKGSGLGLFIARNLMVEQEGDLTYQPRPGGGASFGISLPTAVRHRRRKPAGDLRSAMAQ